MKVVTSIAVLLLGLTVPGGASGRADCPEGLAELVCEGISECEPPGAFCCGANACPSDQICLRCEDTGFCRSPGSTCCGPAVCPPEQECTTCGTETSCRPRGESCILTDLD